MAPATAPAVADAHCKTSIAAKYARLLLRFRPAYRVLGRALPNAPQHTDQTVQDPAILHTTLARLLKPTRASAQASGRMLRVGEDSELGSLRAAVGRMTEALCGLRLTLRELW